MSNGAYDDEGNRIICPKCGQALFVWFGMIVHGTEDSTECPLKVK